MSKLNELIRDGVINNNDVSQLNKNNYANLFDVVNKGSNSYFNLCRGIHFENVDKMDNSNYQEYLVKENDSWTNISFNFYNTVELWWLICKFNNIRNPFTELKAGTYIKIPNDELKESILNIIERL